MTRRWPIALALLLARPGVASAAAPVHAQTQQIFAPMRAGGDQFGSAIAVEGDLAVISAPAREVSPYVNAGEVYTLVRSGDDWVVTGSIVEANYYSHNRDLGRVMDIEGTMLALGSPGHNSGAGAAFVYTHDGAAWNLIAALFDAAPKYDGRFGVAVGVSAGQVLVGESLQTLPAMDATTGKVNVFDQSVAWVAPAQLMAADAEDGDRFGYALAVDGDTAVVGAPGKEGARGAAYVFTRSAGVWTQEQKLVLAGERVANDFFGAAVAISGEQVLVGARGRAAQQGAAYVFQRGAGTWSQLQELTAEAPMPGEVFGSRVALGSERAVVTGWGFEQVPMVGPRGGGYLFGRGPEGFHLLAALRTDDGVPGDFLGIGLALSDREALLGAPYDDAPAQPNPDLAKAPGAASVFALTQATGEPCVVDGDCADADRCCDLVCVAVPVCAVDTTGGETEADSTGPEPTTGAMTGQSSGVVSGSNGSSDSSSAASPPELEFTPGEAGCACSATGSGAPCAPAVLVIVTAFALRRRRVSQV